VTEAALRDLAARAAAGDGRAREQLTGAARAQARDILSQDRFTASHRGGNPLRDLLSHVGDAVRALTAITPGGPVVDLLALVVLVAAVASVAASFVARRRASAGPDRGRRAADPAARWIGPQELERRAAQAERDGDLDAAVRLRFQAGLLRLGDARAIDLRPSLTSGEIARQLRSARFDALARTHDAVAYGGRPAAAGDAARAREDWPAVVGEARRP
jgi:UPF0716 family protein affecting phage T7 exclusion